jgi:uncharacterized protein
LKSAELLGKRTMAPQSVVINTNIWVSYFISQRFDDIANLIFDNNLVVYSSPDLIHELEDVLSRGKLKKQITLPLERYISLHKNLTTVAETKKVFRGSPDVKDTFLFDLALQTKSKIIVTGDKKLLLFEVKNLEIISLSTFKERLSHL